MFLWMSFKLHREDKAVVSPEDLNTFRLQHSSTSAVQGIHTPLSYRVQLRLQSRRQSTSPSYWTLLSSTPFYLFILKNSILFVIQENISG